MIDPYRMIFVNIIALFILIFLVACYKFIFPKKNPNLFVLLILISCLPIISIFRTGVYESGDMALHTYRTISFYTSLSEGILISSWAGNLNGTYGYPLFLFNYNFPYYIVSFIHFLGFSFIDSIKLFLASSFIFSGIFMFLWAKNEFKNELAAFCAAIFYLFSPYHLVDLHFRVAIGELTAFCLLPLLFYFINKFINSSNKIYLLYITLTFTSIVLSHAGSAVFSFLLIVPYILLLQKKDKIKSSVLLAASFLLSILFSFYLIIPYSIYVKYTFLATLTTKIVSFVNIGDLLFSPYRMGFLFQGPMGQLSFLIGYPQIFVILAGFVIFIKNFNKSKVRKDTMWLVLGLIIIFLMTPYSRLFWNTFTKLNVIQFSFRLHLLLTFVIAVLAAFLASYSKKKTIFIFALIFITICCTILNWGNRKVISDINDSYLVKTLPLSTSRGEGFCCAGSPIWTDPQNPWFAKTPKSYLEIIKGNVEWKNVLRKSTDHRYAIFAKTNSKVRENTEYFPGWKVKIDNKEVKVNVTDKYPMGIIEFDVPPGIHFIQLTYEDLPILKVFKTISLLGVLMSLLTILFYNAGRILNRKSIVV